MTATILLALALPACGEDKDSDTDTDATATATATATDASTGGASTDDASTGGTTGGTVTDSGADTTAADTTAADTTAADTTAAETTDPTTGSSGGLSFAADVWPFMVVECGCHTVGPSGGLLMGMDAASAYASMVNVPSSIGMNHVTPGDPDTSYLFHKVNGSQVDAGGGGSTMPLGAPKLDQDQIDTITEWIAGGAAQ